MENDSIVGEYARSLQEYLAGGGDAALDRAGEIGKSALGDGLGILDVAHASLLRLNESLEQKNVELDVVRRELEAFSYSVAHDLRAPLRAITGFSRVLSETYAEKLDAQAQSYLQRISAGTRLMGELVDAMIALSRVSRSELRPQRVDLTALATSIADQLRAVEPSAVEPSHDAAFTIQTGLVAYGDPRLLHALFENLLDNAWKFTRHRTRATIEVGSTSETGFPTYFVKDNGVGFDMAHADKLFAPFQKLHAAGEFPGIGIGLATVQRIVHRHRGRVRAEASVDNGASVFFTLPLLADEKLG